LTPYIGSAAKKIIAGAAGLRQDYLMPQMDI